MQTDNTTAIQTAIDLACVFASPFLNSGQDKLGHLAIDVSLAVFSRMVLTDEADNAIKIQALKSYLSNSNGVENYQHEFYSFLALNDFDNLKTLISEKLGDWREIDKSLPLIASQWAENAHKWGVRFGKDVVSTNNTAKKQTLYALLRNPPEDFYEMFFYNKAVRDVQMSNRVVQTAQRMNQDLLKDIASNNFLSVSEVQTKIKQRRNEVNTGGKRSIRLPPGAE